MTLTKTTQSLVFFPIRVMVCTGEMIAMDEHRGKLFPLEFSDNVLGIANMKQNSACDCLV